MENMAQNQVVPHCYVSPAPTEWSHSCANIESKLHQLSPYIGKLKSTIAEDLIKTYSCEGDIILDPFSGSGTIPLSAAYLRRGVIAADISQYSAILTKGKLFSPKNVDEALLRLEVLEQKVRNIRPPKIEIPTWVRSFFSHSRVIMEPSRMVRHGIRIYVSIPTRTGIDL